MIRHAARIFAVAVLAVGIMLPVMALAASSPSSPSVLVTTEPVRSGSLSRTITAYGRVGPAPGASHTLTLAYAGIVTAVYVTPGMTVHKGDTIAEISPAPSTRASYRQAQATLSASQQTLAHTQALLSQHLATRTQLAQARQAEQSAQAALDALKSEGAGQQEATLSAPYTGVVRSLAATPGAELQAGAPVATIDRNDRLVATVGIDPGEAQLVSVGDRASVSGFGLGLATKDRTNPSQLSGTIMTVSGMVNLKTGLIDATIRLKNPGAVIGEVVTATIQTGAVHGVIIPRDAVLPTEGQDVVWQVKNGHAVKVKVDVLASAHGNSIVAGAINRHLPIVISGNYQLQSGISVRVSKLNGF